jgi:hypothetical protein
VKEKCGFNRMSLLLRVANLQSKVKLTQVTDEVMQVERMNFIFYAGLKFGVIRSLHVNRVLS